ncbi:rhodanese-like domain-containing protein [Candidatus Micrarchaeota archaeon]|nr:rhodanese-like domain-containing protein [Candidatus Micrarchaeota archaeon]
METEPFQIDHATEITVLQLKQLLQTKTPPRVLDIRQPEELDEVPAIPTAVNIPMTQLLARLAEVPKQSPNGGAIILVCASGARSLMAQKFLAAKGYDCKSLAGGMVAWDRAKQC